MASLSSANPLTYVVKRQNGDLQNVKTKLFDGLLRVAKNLFKKDLVCHYGCVNAIEFSDDGEYLISGGDDRRVILWRFGETLFGHSKPEQMTSEHLSNIFCLAITPDNSRIFSGGNDDQVIVHDTETKRIVELLRHQKAVSGIAIDPFNPRVIATAGIDGRLLVFDTRQSVDESQVVSRSRKSFHGVTFHPTQSSVLAAANSRDGATLWDIRKPKHPVIRYGGSSGLTQNCMSVRFDSRGRHVLALRRRLPPVLYATHAPTPRAHFYHPDYYNSCTMKSCCFAGDRDQYILSGSDDFNLYMWRVPDAEGVWVDKTHMVLYGHRSIVNQVRYNPHYCIIASSGVEKIIKTWSPLEIPGASGSLLNEQLGPDNPRDVYSHEEYINLVHHSGQYITHNYADESTSEDPRMMAFFDSLVQREIEGWSAEESDLSGGRPRQAHHRRNSRSLVKDSDSSDSDQMMVDFLPLPPKRGNLRHHENRIMRLLTARSVKLLSRLTQKRMGPRRNSKRDQSRQAAKLTPIGRTRARCARALQARRGLRRGVLSPPPPVVHSEASSDSDSDTPQPRLYRHASKMTRCNRRRMSNPRNAKNKANVNFRGRIKNSRKGNNEVNHNKIYLPNTLRSSYLENSAYNNEDLAAPSTSTGIRGSHNTTLFRIDESSSDDDLSVSSKSPTLNQSSQDTSQHPYIIVIPKPLNGSRDTTKSTSTSPRREPSLNRYGSNNIGMRLQHLRERNDALPAWNSRNNDLGVYTPTLSRLRNESNESEVESSCSTGSPADDLSSPRERLRIGNSESPIAGSSSGKAIQSAYSQPKNESGWVPPKLNQITKRTNRNYRIHIGESDSG